MYTRSYKHDKKNYETENYQNSLPVIINREGQINKPLARDIIFAITTLFTQKDLMKKSWIKVVM